jgi:hypothetical protein
VGFPTRSVDEQRRRRIRAPDRDLAKSSERRSRTRVSEKPRRAASPGFFYFPRPFRDLRRVLLRGESLWFEREHAGCDREPHVHDRLPKISVANSLPLWLESPLWLALLSRSHPGRESRTSRRAMQAGHKTGTPTNRSAPCFRPPLRSVAGCTPSFGWLFWTA